MNPVYSALDTAGAVIPPGEHKAVRVDHPLLANPIIVTAHRSPKAMTWKQAKEWAEKLDTNGWSWRLPTAEEAFLICDRNRTKRPMLPTEFFPDCDGEYLWTSTEDLTPPSGCAWVVGTNGGDAIWGGQFSRCRVRAVRAGQ